jgi:hypothetical protein
MVSSKKENPLNKQCALLQPFGDDAESKPLLLQDIESFQKEEGKILNKMQQLVSETPQTTSTSQKLRELELQIKPIQNSRMRLLKQLTYVASSSQCSLSGDRRALQDQLAMLMIAEDQIKMMETQTQQLINSKNNKHRMVQITNYENDRFASHASIFKTIAFCSLFVLGGIFINSRGWDYIGNTIIIFSIAVATFLTVNSIWWNYWRSSMDWNQFEWPSNIHGRKNTSVWQVDRRFFEKGYNSAVNTTDDLGSRASSEYDKMDSSKDFGHFKNDLSKALTTNSTSPKKMLSNSDAFSTFN